MIPPDNDQRPWEQRLRKVAIDSNVLTYLLDGFFTKTYDPAHDPDDSVRPQRVAAAQIFLYHPIGSALHVTPTVLREVGAISADGRRLLSSGRPLQ